MKTHLHLPKLASIAGAVLLALSAQIATADYSSTVAGFSPLGYWRLDETAAAPALNKLANSGTAGSSADGFGVMDVVNGQSGVVGTSVRLNNPGVTIGYAGSKIEVPYSAAIAPNYPFSVEFWAKPNALPASDTTGVCPLSCFNQNWFGGANRSGWLFYVRETGRWQFRLGLTSGYAAIVSGTSGNASPGVWQHIVATYDGSTVRLYANGVQIASAASSAASTGWLPNTQSSLRIGGTPLNGNLSDNPAPLFNNTGQGHSGNRGWDGWMDEVAIYTNVLDASTVAAHYSAATTNNAGYGAQILAASPAGYWNLDEPVVTAPNQSTFPIVANSGTLGTAADGTNMWGSLTAQTGSSFGGLGVNNKACFLDSVNGYIALPDAAGLHFSGNITLMAWVKPTVQDFFRDIIAHGWDGGHQETFLRISRGVGGTGAGDANYYEVGATDNTTYTYKIAAWNSGGAIQSCPATAAGGEAVG